MDFIFPVKPTLFYDSELLSTSVTGNNAQFVIRYHGEEITLAGDASNLAFCEKFIKNNPSNTPVIGLARLIQRKGFGSARNRGAYRFDPYIDQSLRRAFDLDSFEFSRETHNSNCIGWRNSKHPDGFLAPKGLVPGQHGRFISSSTQDIPVAIPLEFVELCSRMRVEPESVLKTFIADLCHLTGGAELPRADGFSNRGGDAERKARDYLKQAWRLKKDFFS